MRKLNLLKDYFSFRAITCLVACLLICSFLVRSFAFRSSESVHKFCMLLDQSTLVSQLENVDLEQDSDEGSALPFNQRSRDGGSGSCHLLDSILISRMSFPHHYKNKSYQRFVDSYSKLALQAPLIGGIDKPPKSQSRFLS
jgi:hypothetical protein